MNLVALKAGVAGMCLGLLCAVTAHADYNFEPAASDRGQSSSDPKNRARIHTELGSMYYQSGNMGVALEELRIALNADSSYFQAYSIRGLVYGALKENGKAEADFRSALDLAPNDPEVNNNYGWYLCDTGRERQSIAYFLNALKNPLYQTPERAYSNAGTCAMKAGDLEGAQNYLLQAVQFSRDGGMTPRFQLAKLFYRKGLYDESRIYLNDALKMMEPQTAEALWLGARLERKGGSRAAEGGYMSQLRSRYPTSPEYQQFLKGNFE